MSDKSLKDRFRGCLIGLAIGDALGVPVEFMDPGTFKPITDYRSGGHHGLKAGEWSDDTSLALCLAESLIEKKGFDPVDQLQRYTRWYREGYLSITGVCFDIGNTTKEAIHKFEATGYKYCGSTEEYSCGNGSLMRLAPIPMYYHFDPIKAIEKSGESSRTTHGHQKVIDACKYMGGIIYGALNGISKEELLSERYSPIDNYFNENPLNPEVDEVVSGSFKKREPPKIRGRGYVVKSLEAALWAFFNSESFEEGCIYAVNLGEDADTTGAIYGQIAGAYYGESGIPQKWRDNLAEYKLINSFIERLYDISLMEYNRMQKNKKAKLDKKESERFIWKERDLKYVGWEPLTEEERKIVRNLKRSEGRLDEILYHKSNDGIFFYDTKEIEPLKAIFFNGRNFNLADSLEVILESNYFIAPDKKAYNISDQPEIFFSDYLPRIFNFTSNVKHLKPIDADSIDFKIFVKIIENNKKSFNISEVPFLDVDLFEVPGYYLIGSRNALRKFHLTEEDIQGFFNESPKNYFLMGFWGHGLNSHAFYYVKNDSKFKIFFRLPFGGVYHNKKSAERIGKFLNLFFDFETKIKDHIKEFVALEAFGSVKYKIIRNDGSKCVYKKSLFRNEDMEVKFKEILNKTKGNTQVNIKTPTKNNIESILEFLPYFSDSNNQFYQVVESKKNKDGIWILGYVSYEDGIMKFIESAYHENFVQIFPWSEWQDEAFKYMENPNLMENADIITIVKLFTLILRKDRFCEGFIADRIDDGFILKILLRLKKIYNKTHLTRLGSNQNTESSINEKETYKPKSIEFYENVILKMWEEKKYQDNGMYSYQIKKYSDKNYKRLSIPTIGGYISNLRKINYLKGQTDSNNAIIYFVDKNIKKKHINNTYDEEKLENSLEKVQINQNLDLNIQSQIFYQDVLLKMWKKKTNQKNGLYSRQIKEYSDKNYKKLSLSTIGGYLRELRNAGYVTSKKDPKRNNLTLYFIYKQHIKLKPEIDPMTQYSHKTTNNPLKQLKILRNKYTI